MIVKPGGRLSLQRHHHCAEHWIVVRGAVRVTVNETVKTVHENESIYIPMGAGHRMENPGKIVLRLIEVQTGSCRGKKISSPFDRPRGRQPAELCGNRWGGCPRRG